MRVVTIEMTGYVLTEEDVAEVSDEARVNGKLRDIEVKIGDSLPFPNGTSVQVGMRANHGRGPEAVPTLTIGGIRLMVGEAVVHHEAVGFVKLTDDLVPAAPAPVKRTAKRTAKKDA